MDATTGPKAPTAVPGPRYAADASRFVVTTLPGGASQNVSAADLLAYPDRATTAESLCATSGRRRHHFQGPLLYDVLCALAPLVAEAPRRRRATCMLRLRGGDGHQAVVSWAEIDPEFADGPFLLATVVDGVYLGDRGPQLVSPGDGCGARFISAITSVDAVLGSP